MSRLFPSFLVAPLVFLATLLKCGLTGAANAPTRMAPRPVIASRGDPIRLSANLSRNGKPLVGESVAYSWRSAQRPRWTRVGLARSCSRGWARLRWRVPGRPNTNIQVRAEFPAYGHVSIHPQASRVWRVQIRR